ncbi:MAG: peptidylprolyl isomerase [Verrucomicrobiota bacterium]|nr:peptidylprolyl isomerase [Verrucomicrobiota bacterium]
MMRLLSFALVASVLIVSASLSRAAAATPAAQQPERAQVTDGMAAVVNGEVITISQVRQLSLPRERLLRSQFTGAELEKHLSEIRALALRDLIDRQLVVQAFREQKLALPDYFVDQRIDEIIRENFGGDRNTFMKTLQAQNYAFSQFRKDEFDKIIVQAMRGKNVKPNTIASPTKIQEYYSRHRDLFTSKEEVKLRMIMIPSKATEGNSASQKAMAEEILGKLAGGADFARMAQMYSEDSTRDLGGDWGWIQRKTLASELEKVAFNLPTKKISNIVQLGGNYYILRVDERRGGVTKPLAEVRSDIEKRITQEEAQRLQENWIAGLRQKANIRTF